MLKRIIIILIVLPSLILADKITYPPLVSGDLRIEYPLIEYYDVSGQYIKARFHVYNSTGSILDNTTTSCWIQFYNNTGNTTIYSNLSYSADTYDFYVYIPTSLARVPSSAAYTVYCTNYMQSGFLSKTAYISKNEYEINNPNMVLPFTLLLISFFFILIYLNNTIPTKDEHNTYIKINVMFKSILFAFLLFISFIVMQVIYAYSLICFTGTILEGTILSLYNLGQNLGIISLWIFGIIFIVGIFIWIGLMIKHAYTGK